MSLLGSRLAKVVPPALLAAVIITLWQAGELNAILGVAPFVLPRPSAILNQLWDGRSVLAQALTTTVVAAAIGYALGNALGVAAGFGVSARRAGRAKYGAGLFGVAQGVPLIAVIPLVDLLLGSGLTFKVVVVAVITAPLTGFYLVRGAAVADRQLHLVFDVYGTSKLQRFLKLLVPGGAGQTFIALRVTSVTALVGVIVCEFIAGSGGLGYQIEYSLNSFDAAAGWAASVVLMALGLAWYQLVAVIEHRLRGRFQY